MTINRTLLQTNFKFHLSNVFFIAFNLFHIIVASSSELEARSEGILQFRILFFTHFNLAAFITALIIVFIQILVSYFVLFRKFNSSELTRLTDLGIIGGDEEMILKHLRIDPKLIHKWVHELAEKQNIKSIKRIYITDTSIPNAFTLDIIPLPFIRATWIVLDANVMEILDEREIKAVIAHELGHVKKFDGIVNIFRFGLNYFLFITYALFILNMLFHIIREDPIVPLNIALKSAFLIVLLFVLWLFTLVSRFFMNYSRRQSELLADYYAAKTVGRNHIINALVLLGQRMDVISAFGTEFKWLGSLEGKNNLTREFVQGLKNLEPEELSKDISREKAVKIYVEQRLRNIRDDLFVPLRDEEIEKLTEMASTKLLKLREESIANGLAHDRKIKQELFKITIDWFLVDKDKDRYLKDEEIESLIKTIKQNPDKELFEEDIQKQKLLLGTDHPSVKERILFLYHACNH